ncbi:hypothetical protein O181_121284, partial [Austropuccinia psidii MF-1]|nr:hypothetical protein [Austropuccinia psidii MF-1]
VEVITSSNQMDLKQDIQVINPKDKIFSPEERHKWKIPEFPPVPKGNNKNIPVSVQELVYGGKEAGVGTSTKSLDRHNEVISSSKEVHGPEKTETLLRGPEEEVGPRKGQQPSGRSPSLHKQNSVSKSAKQGQVNPKEKSEGREKGKGKGESQVELALPTELQISQERKESHGKCVEYGKNSEEILEKLNNSEYIQQKLGKEILQVKESQKTLIGLESVTKDNILNLTNICARIGSKFTLLNQPDEDFISFITKQSRELRIQVQNLENSSYHIAALFQEQLEKSDKARLELKEDIQSSINNISLKNELLRQYTQILDRNVLNVNNDLNHTISSNAEVETACNFKYIPRLEECPTFSGEGEYNHMEFMKRIDMFKEDFNIPDEYIIARLHSFFTKQAKKWYYKRKQDYVNILGLGGKCHNHVF